MTSAQQASVSRSRRRAPASWKLDAVHFPRPLTRYWAEMHPAPFKRGSTEFARFYGMLIGGLAMAYVNGFGYMTQLPGAGEEIPQRFQRADEVFERKLWREQLRDWDETSSRPRSRRTGSCSRSIPTRSPTTSWPRTSTRCRDHHAAMIYQHMRFTAARSCRRATSSPTSATGRASRRPSCSA